jgi:hypothetical protein
MPPEVDIPRYLASTRGQVDYVLTQAAEVADQLGPDYVPICTSEPNGHTRLFLAQPVSGSTVRAQ